MRAKIAWLCAITSLTFLPPYAVAALPASFSNSVIIQDSDFTDLPNYFAGRDRESSIALIQKFLEASGSALAKAENNKSDNTNDLLPDGKSKKDFSKLTLDIPTNWEHCDGTNWLTGRPFLQKYTGKTMSFAEAIWAMSQEDLVKSKYCDLDLYSTINPTYLLALIQKESGMIFGSYNNVPYVTEYTNQSLNFRYNRITGYSCFDGAEDCLYLGPFRQIYLGVRDTKLWSQGCKIGFNNLNSKFAREQLQSLNSYKVGNSISVDGKSIKLETAIACSHYIYTPHDTYLNFFKIIKYIDSELSKIAVNIPLSNTSQVVNLPELAPIPPPSIPETFNGVEKKTGAVQEVIKKEAQVVKKNEPPPYSPIYIETPVEQSTNTYPIDFAKTVLSGRSVSEDTTSSVLGVQDVRSPWYLHPAVVLTGVYATLQSLLLAVYWLIRQRK